MEPNDYSFEMHDVTTEHDYEEHEAIMWNAVAELEKAFYTKGEIADILKLFADNYENEEMNGSK